MSKRKNYVNFCGVTVEKYVEHNKWLGENVCGVWAVDTFDHRFAQTGYHPDTMLFDCCYGFDDLEDATLFRLKF